LTIFIVCLALPLFAQWRVMSTYRKYSEEPASSGMTAAQAARRLLDRAGLSHVKVESVEGHLSDHYDPRTKTLRLSAPQSTSIAAIGVAAHEAGHALQDAEKYPMLVLRSAVVPVAQFAPPIGMMLFMAGLFFTAFKPLLWVGIVLFAAAVVFTLITLPVEFDASSRAMRILRDGGIAVGQKELGAANKVLGAAALTYVAAAVTAVLQLISMILQAQSRRE
jgi:Zn-dependent membrane protease YugP